jgi:hypothetical protein
MVPSPGLLLGTTLTVGLLLCSCSGNPIGERLAAGFDPPATPPVRPSLPAQPAPPATVSPSPPAALPPPAKPAAPPQDLAKAKTDGGAKPVAPKVSTAKPLAGSSSVPYRVTLKLPAADPAAPAEAVTEALRTAGVRFEVETIERIRSSGPAEGGQSGGPAPVSTPAPPPR